MDIWALLLKTLFRIKPLNYGLVGRWLIYLCKGVFQHRNITETKPIKTELLIGWIAHYLIGVLFSIALIKLVGNHWLSEPEILPALAFGLASAVVPLFIMQPSMGLGIGASKTPQPNIARFRSMLTHIIFGLGLYCTALLLAIIPGIRV